MFITTNVEFESCSWRGILGTTLCDQACQCLATGRGFASGTPVSSTNKTDRHDITEILLKVALKPITTTTTSSTTDPWWILEIHLYNTGHNSADSVPPSEGAQQRISRCLPIELYSLYVHHSTVKFSLHD